MISFNKFNNLDNSTEIGYWLATKFVGKGIMQRAVMGMCELGFTEYQVNKIEIHAAVENARSNKVAERTGFHLDGLIRASELLEDGYHDVYIWTLLKDELKKIKECGMCSTVFVDHILFLFFSCRLADF